METEMPITRFSHGQVTASDASRVWEMMSQKERRRIIWDVPMQARQSAFVQAISNAPLSGFASADDSALCGWCYPIGPNSQAAAIHFATAGQSQWFLPAARDFCSEALERFTMLIGLVPAHWRGARSFARAVGLAEIMLMPKACFIAQARRCIDGILLAGRADGSVQK